MASSIKCEVSLWPALVRRLAVQPRLSGYGLFQGHPRPADLALLYRCGADGRVRLEEGYQKAIAQIRPMIHSYGVPLTGC